MKTFNEILLVILGCVFIYCICFIPFKGNYTINNANEETEMMDITYSSIIPFIKKDTCVKMPTYVYGQVLYNYYKTNNNKTIYYTAIKVDDEIYTYKNISAYHYVKQFSKGDSITLLEIYWPDHYIKTLSLHKEYGEE